jgi:hypothetical protein
MQHLRVNPLSKKILSGPPAANRHRIGASCYAAPGQRQFRLTIAGCRLIVGTSGLGCIFQVSGSEGAGEIAIAVDCSGHVLYFDTEVQKAEVYQAGHRSTHVSLDSSRRRFAPFSKDNGRVGWPIALIPVGGGGTNFAPCFRWLDERGIVPQTLVFLTDLCGAFPKRLLPIQCCGPPQSRVERHLGSDSNGSGLTFDSMSKIFSSLRRGRIVGQCPVCRLYRQVVTGKKMQRSSSMVCGSRQSELLCGGNALLDRRIDGDVFVLHATPFILLFGKRCIFDEFGEGRSCVALHIPHTDIPQDVVVTGGRLLANYTAKAT